MGRLLVLLALSFGHAAEPPHARRALEIFQRLLAVSGSPRRVGFVVMGDWKDPQAIDYLDSSYGPDVRLRVGVGFLEAFGGDDRALMATLAHEAGHVVQDSEDAILDRLEKKYGSKRIEAHADLIGAQLARKDGWTSQDYLAGREKKFGCDLIRSKADVNVESHPMKQDQWVNIMLYQEFEDVTIDMFDEKGVLRPSRLIKKPSDASDNFIEAAGSRAALAQYCGQPQAYTRVIEGVRNRIQRVKDDLPW